MLGTVRNIIHFDLVHKIFNILDPLLTVAAGLSVQSPFLRNATEEVAQVHVYTLYQLTIAQVRNNFITEHGDPFTLLNIYNEWLDIKMTDRENSRKWCRRHGIEEQRLYEISKLRNQFKDLLRDSKLIEVEEESNPTHLLPCHLKEKPKERTIINTKSESLKNCNMKEKNAEVAKYSKWKILN